MKGGTVVCFGDSNTWGAVPQTRTEDGERFGRAVRWPGRLADHLGPGWEVVGEGLPGRTTEHPDPVEGAHKAGLPHLLACLESHAPIARLVIMLGTNDLKERFHLPAEAIAEGAGRLCDLALESGTLLGGPERILLICPAPILEAGPHAWMFRGGAATSRGLAAAFAAVARARGAGFLDAGSVLRSSALDGIHLDSEAHRALAQAVAERLLAADHGPAERAMA